MYQSIFKAKVSYLPQKDAPDNELKTISLGRALIADTWRAQVEAVRAETDPAKQEALKKALPVFTPSGTFSHIARRGLKQHSGFISIDIDCKPDKGINLALVGFDLKAAVAAAAVPHIAYCGLSCRGAGYVCIIPIADPTKHSEYFRALAYHFERAGLEIDRDCRDISRKRFVSWDPDPYINTAARPWALTLPERDHSTRETLGRDLDTSETAAAVEARDVHVWLQRPDGAQEVLFTYPADSMRSFADILNRYRAKLPEDGHLYFFSPQVADIANNIIGKTKYTDWGTDLVDVLQPMVDEGITIVDDMAILSPYLNDSVSPLYPTEDYHWHAIAASLTADELMRMQGVAPADYDQYRYYLGTALSCSNIYPQYFSRLFTKNVGISFTRHLNRVRISHIYRDVVTTDLPVMQILETHGFTNYKLFSRMFRNIYGGTPREVRRRNRERSL